MSHGMHRTQENALLDLSEGTRVAEADKSVKRPRGLTRSEGLRRGIYPFEYTGICSSNLLEVIGKLGIERRAGERLKMRKIASN